MRSRILRRSSSTRRLARALAADAAALAISSGSGLAQPRREVDQARNLDLELGLAALGVAVKDLDDHARAIEHLGAGGALEVAHLAR